MLNLTTPWRRRIALYAVLVALAVITSCLLTKSIDLRVYWHGTAAAFDGPHPLYGPESGIGFPMHYRYPPVTYLLLWPLSRMPLYWAGVIWALGAWAAAISTTALAIRSADLRLARGAIAAAAAYLLSYVLLALRSGNVQPYVIAMVFAALLLSESNRLASAFLLALAITFKIWPLFFLPWFLHRPRRLVLAWLLPVLLALWLFPLVVWSPFRYADLLHQWYCFEFQSATIPSEAWYFPGQSLRGVLLRYTTNASPWLKGFPSVHFLSLSPRAVIRAWEVMAAAIYGATCVAMLRSKPSRRWVWDGVSFSLFTVLEPFCLKSGMISLGPAVLVSAALYSRGNEGTTTSQRLASRLFLAASALSFSGAIAQYKPLLRVLLVLGIDFYAAVLLLVALLVWTRMPESGPDSVSASAVGGG